MNWLNKLERKFGRLAIPGLMYYIVILNAIVFFFMYLDKSGTIVNILALDPALVMKGEVWRLISYIFIPPTTSLLFIVFVLLFYYTVGVGLEQEWGSFKFNMYYLVGMVATTLAAFITGGGDVTGIYLNLSLFLAFAYLYPDYQVMIFFIIPLKVKYLAWLDWAFIAYTVLTQPFSAKVVAVVSLANYILFFGKDLLQHTKRQRQVYDNRRKFQVENAYVAPAHVCEYCGMTEKTDPNMVFQHCPDCDPKYEYCTKHIKIHQHVPTSK